MVGRRETGRRQWQTAGIDAKPRRRGSLPAVDSEDRGWRQVPAEPGGGGRWQRVTGMATHLFADHARPLRFVLVGGVCGALQLGLLALFLRWDLAPVAANVAAFLVSAQLNFALSARFTWHDRAATKRPAFGLLHRWLAFHGSIAGTAVLNQIVFILGHAVVADLVAAGVGIGVAAIVNFVVQDQLVFRGRRGRADADAVAIPAYRGRFGTSSAKSALPEN